MPAIATIKVQIPPGLSAMVDIEYDERGRIVRLTPAPAWQQFFHAVQMITFYTTASGPTGSRPTASSNSDKLRWVGQPFFDTTLGYPVWLKIASTNVWVDATGTPA